MNTGTLQKFSVVGISGCRMIQTIMLIMCIFKTESVIYRPKIEIISFSKSEEFNKIIKIDRNKEKKVAERNRLFETRRMVILI